jgi:hypothetical protein
MVRRAARVDNTQPDIVRALRNVGAEVWVTGQPVDLLVAFRGRWTPIEVKSSEADAKRCRTGTEQRQREHRNRAEKANCTIPVVWTDDMALKAIGAIK